MRHPIVTAHNFVVKYIPPPFSWIYLWMEWWTLLPFRIIGLGWQHKKIALLVILAMIASIFFHDHSNSFSGHGVGPVRFVLVGFMNFFYGIIESVLHFGADVLKIPEKLNGCPPGESFANLVGFIIGAVVILYSWCIADTLLYWLVYHVLSMELVWGLMFTGFVYMAFLSGGKSGGHAAAPKPSGGSHAPAHH